MHNMEELVHENEYHSQVDYQSDESHNQEDICMVTDREPPVPSPLHEIQPVPDGGWGWMVVVGSTLTHLLLVGMARSFGLLFALLLDQFDETAAATAWATSIFNMVRTLNSPVCAWLCKRWNCRVVAFAGALIMGIGLASSAFVKSLYTVYITLGIIGGFGAGMTFTPCYIIVGEYFNKKMGKAMGFSTLGCGIGTILFGPLVSILASSYGLFGTFLVLSAIQLNTAVGAMLYIPLRKTKEVLSVQVSETMPLQEEGKDSCILSENDSTEKQIISQEQARHSVGCCRKRPNGLCSAGSLWRNMSFIVFCFLMFAMQICIQGFLLYLPTYSLEKNHGQKMSSLLVSFYGIGDVLGRILFGILFDLGAVRHSRKYFYYALSILFGLATISAGLIHNYIGCGVVTMIIGMLQAGCHGQRTTVVGDMVVKDQLAMAVGFLLFSQGVGSISGPPLAGLLADIYGTKAVSFYFSGIPVVIVAVICICENSVNRKKDNHIH